MRVGATEKRDWVRERATEAWAGANAFKLLIAVYGQMAMHTVWHHQISSWNHPCMMMVHMSSNCRGLFWWLFKWPNCVHYLRAFWLCCHRCRFMFTILVSAVHNVQVSAFYLQIDLMAIFAFRPMYTTPSSQSIKNTVWHSIIHSAMYIVAQPSCYVVVIQITVEFFSGRWRQHEAGGGNGWIYQYIVMKLVVFTSFELVATCFFFSFFLLALVRVVRSVHWIRPDVKECERNEMCVVFILDLVIVNYPVWNRSQVSLVA